MRNLLKVGFQWPWMSKLDCPERYGQSAHYPHAMQVLRDKAATMNKPEISPEIRKLSKLQTEDRPDLQSPERLTTLSRTTTWMSPQIPEIKPLQTIILKETKTEDRCNLQSSERWITLIWPTTLTQPVPALQNRSLNPVKSTEKNGVSHVFCNWFCGKI